MNYYDDNLESYPMEKNKSKLEEGRENDAIEILKVSLLEAMENDVAQLREEMKNYEQHIFSEEFERKMEVLFTVGKESSTYNEIQNSSEILGKGIEEVSNDFKKKHVFPKKWLGAVKYAAAILAVAVVVGGVFVSQRSSAQASILGIDILGWFDKFFTVEDGDVGKGEKSTLFEESQIGYLPEGFEKVNEVVLFSLVQYEFRNKLNNYVIIKVTKDKIESNIDNEGIETKVCLSEKGVEYTLIQNDDINRITLMWIGENGNYYYIEGTVEYEEVIQIMNNITY